MALRLKQKKEIVASVADSASRALSIVAVDYRGLSSVDMTELRAKARTSGVGLRVVRNTLAKIAFADTSYKCLSEALLGPVLLAFADEEPGANARLLRDFAKEHANLEVKGIALNGELFDKSQLDAIASLPTRDEALAKLLSVMQAPISKLVCTLAAPQAKLVRVLNAIRDKKQQEEAA